MTSGQDASTRTPFAVAVIQQDEIGDFYMLVTAVDGYYQHSVGHRIHIPAPVVADLLLDTIPCNWPTGDPGAEPDDDPCHHPALDGRNWCAFHSSVTAGLQLR